MNGDFDRRLVLNRLPDYYNQFNKERKINSYLKKLKSLGWEMPSAITESPA